MSKKDPTDKKVADLLDYMPEREVDDVEEVDLNFGFNEGEDDADEDEGTEDDGDDASDEDSEDADEGEGAKNAGDKGKSGTKSAKAGDDKDGEDDEDEDADPGETADKKAKAGKKAAKHMVPKSRLDAVLAANRELKAELDRKNTASAPADDATKGDEPKKFDFDSAEDAYQDAILDGDKAKAKEIRAQMRAAERAEIEADMAKKTGTTSQRERINDAILASTAKIEREFPVLNSESDEYDEGVAQEMIELYTGYVASGKDPMDALEKALSITVKMHDLVGDAPAGKGGKKTDVSDKLKANKQQPPKMPKAEAPSKKAKDPDELDVNTMTDDEWDALPEGVKARLRGDTLV